MRIKKRFKKVYVEITNVCNLSCAFCPGTTRKPEIMGLEDFKLVLERIKNYTDYIYFHIMGEPMLHPHFSDFIDLSGSKGFKVNITTNGSMLSESGKYLLSPYVHRINISVHSFSENNIAFEDYIQNIINWAGRISTQGNANVFLRLWNYDEGFDGTNDLILSRFEKGFNLDFKLKARAMESEGNILSGKNIKVINKVYVSFASKFSWPDMQAPDYGCKGYCLGLKDQIGVLVDGTIVPCCLDSEGTIALGNIFQEELEGILSSKRVQCLHEGFSRGIVMEELCRRCQFRTRFN
jgi:radical SAM protein with 4Fe4S-binding SPASM domain